MCIVSRQTYGFEHMLTLHNLEAVGLLKAEGHRNYPTLRKTLKLVVEEVKEQVCSHGVTV